MMVSKEKVGYGTDGLAGVGGRVDLVTLLTLAFVTADLVDANLAAGVRVGTLIDIFTAFSINQAIPSRTQTLVAKLQVIANMRTAAVVVQTLVGATIPQRLVRPIPAIPPPVTHPLHANALPASAPKPAGGVTVGRIDTARFITQVLAVVLLVAPTDTRDTGAITTLILIRVAGDTNAVGFVRLVNAVSLSIAPPDDREALSTVTVEFRGRALASRTALCSAVLRPLVRAIRAVDVAVTDPQAGNTGPICALEPHSTAGDGRAGSLVAAVITIIHVITHRGGRHALAVSAAKLHDSAWRR